MDPHGQGELDYSRPGHWIQDEVPADGHPEELWVEMICRNCGEVMWNMWHKTATWERWRKCPMCFCEWEQWPDGRTIPARQLSQWCAVMTVWIASAERFSPPASIRLLFGDRFSVAGADAS